MANQDMIDSSRNPNLGPRSNRRPNQPAGQPLSDQNGVDSQRFTDSQRFSDAQGLSQNSNQPFDRNRSGQVVDKNQNLSGQRLDQPMNRNPSGQSMDGNLSGQRLHQPQNQTLPNQRMDSNLSGQRLDSNLSNQNLDSKLSNQRLDQNGQRLDQNLDEEQRLPVIEETLQVGKREVDRGGVRVQSRIVEQPVDQQINLREEHVHVERRPVNRPVAPGDMAAFREGTIEMTERAEEAVVAKQARVVEEVLIGKEVSQKTQQIHDTVRHTEVSIDRLGGQLKNTAFQPFETFDADFRQDWNNNYAKLGGSYDHYAPLYRYGYNLATARQFAGKGWDTIETDARSAWEEQNPGTWEKVKMAVRHGWDRVTGKV